MRRRQAAVALLEPPETLVTFDDADWLTATDPQPDGTETRFEERTILARQRWAGARRDWSGQMKAAGRTLPEINAALFPARFDPRDPDPRRAR